MPLETLTAQRVRNTVGVPLDKDFRDKLVDEILKKTAHFQMMHTDPESFQVNIGQFEATFKTRHIGGVLHHLNPQKFNEDGTEKKQPPPLPKMKKVKIWVPMLSTIPGLKKVQIKGQKFVLNIPGYGDIGLVLHQSFKLDQFGQPEYLNWYRVSEFRTGHAIITESQPNQRAAVKAAHDKLLKTGADKIRLVMVDLQILN